MRKFLSLVLALAMAMSLVVVNTSAKEFTDDDELNYDEAVAVISEIGVVDGYADGSFNPQGGLTRGAAAKIICNLILGPTTAAELHADTRPFSDVAINSEFAGYIAYCAQQGIISGYADGEFKAANPLTGYAFMKMLLGALGYSSDIEGFVGENWSIQVAKQAIGIGLNSGLVDTFNGVDYVTREEAALYAFNTLKATLVDYENTITADVNGASVTISNNTAKPVTWSEGINEDGNIKRDNFVQFAEEYFPDLVRSDDSTKFMEPANTWTYAKTEIGTYERLDLLVESYTTGVSGREIYDLLKSGVIKENEVDMYVDGVSVEGATGDVAVGPVDVECYDDSDLVRSNTEDLPGTGNGVLTKVYLDTDKELIVIVSIDTFLAKALTDYNETSEYATLQVYDSANDGKYHATSYNVDVEEVSNVVDVTADTFYRVNISYADVDRGEVVVVNDVEIMEDSTITEYSSDDGNDRDGTAKVTDLTTGGEDYSANEKAFYDDDVLYQYDADLLTDATYNIYLDQYGYFLGVELFEGSKNYVFITGFDRGTSNLSVKTATAGAIFLDGTMENIQVNVTDTDDNIAEANKDHKAGDDHGDMYVEWSDLNYEEYSNGYQVTDEGRWSELGKYGRDGIYDLNQWYTYTVNEDTGVYTLKPAVRSTWTVYDRTGDDVIIRTDNLSVADDVPATVQPGVLDQVKGRVYGEDASVFITVDLDIVDTSNGEKAITDVNGVYTGVQNVDILVNTADDEAIEKGQVYTVFDSDGYIIGAVIIGEALGNTGNYAYILSEAKAEGRTDGYYYWKFDAILDGVKQTLTARTNYNRTIGELDKYTVRELRFDGDYVVDVNEPKDSDVYDNFLEALGDQGVYLMDGSNTTAREDNTPTQVSTQRNTMYITSRDDRGLALKPDAKGIVIQKENGKEVVSEWASVELAIDHLGDNNPTTTDVKEYKGDIVAILDGNGAAEWVVFRSETPVNTTGGGSEDMSSGKWWNATIRTFATGAAVVNVNVTRPTYLDDDQDLFYTFDVYVDGVPYATVYDATATIGTCVADGQNTDSYTWDNQNTIWYAPIDPNATVEVRNFEWVNLNSQDYLVQYVDEENHVLATGGRTNADAGTPDVQSGVIATGLTSVLDDSTGAQITFNFDNTKYTTEDITYTVTGAVSKATGLAESNVTKNWNGSTAVSTTTADYIPVDGHEGYVKVIINMSNLGDVTPTYKVDVADGMNATLAAIVDRDGTAAAPAAITGLGLGVTEAATLKVEFMDKATGGTGNQTQGINAGESVYMNVNLTGAFTNAQVKVTVTVNGTPYSYTFKAAGDLGRWFKVNSDLVVDDIDVSVTPKLAINKTVTAKGLADDGMSLLVTFNQSVATDDGKDPVATDFNLTAAGGAAITSVEKVGANAIRVSFSKALDDGDTLAITAAGNFIGGGIASNTVSGDLTIEVVDTDGDHTYEDCTFT